MVFSMSLSCFLLEYRSNDKEKIHRFFTKRIRDPKYSKGWKFIFYFLKYIHVFTLLVLAIYGCTNLNNVKNLGFMLCFCFYTAYESFYRKTCKVLIMFIATFIVGQYYFSLFYDVTVFNKGSTWTNKYETMKSLAWFDFIPNA